MSRNRPRVTFIVLADAHKVGDRGKIDCFGIFNRVGVWGIPANRECSIVFGLSGMSAGDHDVSMWFRYKHEKARKVASGTIEASPSSGLVTLAERMPLPITHLGDHSVGLSLGSQESPTSATWLPLEVHELAWPQPLAPTALALALADPHTIKAAQATLICTKCSSKYIFGVTLDPVAELPRGVLRFPEGGIFRCPKCDTVHFLRDIEGQLRSQLGRSAGGEVK